MVVVTEIIAAVPGEGKRREQLGEKLTVIVLFSFDGRSFGGATRFWWVGAESSRTKVGGA